MKQPTKDVIVIVLCIIALIIAFYFLNKSDGFQTKVDQVLGQQDVMYASERILWQGSAQ